MASSYPTSVFITRTGEFRSSDATITPDAMDQLRRATWDVIGIPKEWSHVEVVDLSMMMKDDDKDFHLNAEMKRVELFLAFNAGGKKSASNPFISRFCPPLLFVKGPCIVSGLSGKFPPREELEYLLTYIYLKSRKRYLQRVKEEEQKNKNARTQQPKQEEQQTTAPSGAQDPGGAAVQ